MTARLRGLTARTLRLSAAQHGRRSVRLLRSGLRTGPWLARSMPEWRRTLELNDAMWEARYAARCALRAEALEPSIDDAGGTQS